MKNITISRTLRRWMEYVSETKNARSLVHRVVKTFKHKSMSIGFRSWLQWCINSKAYMVKEKHQKAICTRFVKV